MPLHFARLRIMDFCTSSYGVRESWTQLCKTIAGMPNLHTLDMRLYGTIQTYHYNREKHWSDDLRHFSQKVFHSPKDVLPISEEFILNSLYQIEQVKVFEVRLEDRGRGMAMPQVRSNAPFKLICEYAADRKARLERKEQEERERQLMKQQEEAEERRLRKEQERADRHRSELKQKAQDIAESYQSFSG